MSGVPAAAIRSREEGDRMTSVPHEPVSHERRSYEQGRRQLASIVVTETWASLAIGAMWLAVALTAVFGPSIVTSSSDGSATRIPSGIVVALFALLGTVSVA